MKQSLALVVMALLVAACSKAPNDQAIPAKAEPKAQVPSAAPRAAPSEVAGESASGDFVFAFTAIDPDKPDARVIEWLDGPCGATPVVRVKSMPLEDNLLLPDFVVEFDAGGKELRRWGKPYEAEVIALSGNRLTFRTHGDAGEETFWTDPSGAIGRVTQAKATIDETTPMLDCPSLPTFAESEYEQCFEVTDTENAKRRLAWEGVCT